MIEFLVGGLVAIVGVAVGAGIILIGRAIEKEDEKNPNTTGARMRRDAREREQVDAVEMPKDPGPSRPIDSTRVYRGIQDKSRPRTAATPALSPDQDKVAN